MGASQMLAGPPTVKGTDGKVVPESLHLPLKQDRISVDHTSQQMIYQSESLTEDSADALQCTDSNVPLCRCRSHPLSAECSPVWYGAETQTCNLVKISLPHHGSSMLQDYYCKLVTVFKGVYSSVRQHKVNASDNISTLCRCRSRRALKIETSENQAEVKKPCRHFELCPFPFLFVPGGQ